MNWNRTEVSLTTRLTAFSLVGLALVLVGLSAAVYLETRAGLGLQAAERLDGAQRTLLAAVEFHDGVLEWEPNQRLVALGQEPEAGEVRWTVRDGANARLVDRSLNLAAPAALATLSLSVDWARVGDRRVKIDGRAWRVVVRRLVPSRLVPSPAAAPGAPFYPSLVLTTALCLEPGEATLRHLGRSLTGMALGVWLVAAALGRWSCRRALGPLTRMAEAARRMGGGESDGRLPSAGTGDELQDLADAFNGLLDRRRDAYERLTRFTGDASHQLRTPLAAMLGQAEVALRRDRTAEEYARTLRRVCDQAAHLGRIVETLLYLARADADAPPPLPGRGPLELRSWAAAHLARWADNSRAGDLGLAPGDGPVWALAQPTLLGQVVDNLLDNACKYSEPGTPVLVIAAIDGAGRPSLAVADRGTGIAAADLPHVFEPFYRASRARLDGRPGVGLGLTVALRVAEALGGRLTASSSDTHTGSVFSLSLPAAPPPADVVEALFAAPVNFDAHTAASQAR